jgi:hypothetical protein
MEIIEFEHAIFMVSDADICRFFCKVLAELGVRKRLIENMKNIKNKIFIHVLGIFGGQ